MSTDEMIENNPELADNLYITARKLSRDEDERLKILVKYFGNYMMEVESLIYSTMEKLAEEYKGGHWEFYELSNGGFYMAPRLPALTLRVVVKPNNFRAYLSTDAVGVVACLLALDRLASSSVKLFQTRFHQLREYAMDHAEWALIFSAID